MGPNHAWLASVPNDGTSPTVATSWLPTPASTNGKHAVQHQFYATCSPINDGLEPTIVPTDARYAPTHDATKFPATTT